MPKADAITFLTTNCACLKGQDAALNALTEEAAEGIADYIESLADHAEFVGTVRNTLGVDAALPLSELNGLVINMKGGKDTTPVPTKPSMTEWLANMPDEAKPTWNSFVKQQEKAKVDLVEKLVANAQGDATAKAAIKTKLEAKSMDQLEELALFLPAQPTQNTTRRQPDYTGAAGGQTGGTKQPVRNNDPDDDGLTDNLYGDDDPLPLIPHTYAENAVRLDAK